MINYNFKFVKPEEYKILLDYIYHCNVEHGLMIEIIGNGGLRVSEVLELTPKDFDYDSNMIIVTTLKRKGHPKIPIKYPVRIMTLMQKYISIIKIKDNEKIFKISRQGIWKMFKKYCKVLKLSKFYTIHSLRHMHGTLVSEATNGNRDTVRSRLRHKSSATADIYTHLTDGQTDKIINKLEENQK